MNRATYRVSWIAFGIAASLGVGSMAAGAPLPQIPVLTTSLGEFQPARSENALAWEQNTRARANQYNVMVQVDGSSPVQANRGGTSAAMGDFAGNQLVFQQYKGNPHIRGRSDLLFFDISSGARTKVQGVNTRQWEYWPSHSDGWLLYGRWKPKKEVRRLFLHDLETGERRLLDKTKGENRFIGPGQVQGNYAVWSTCRSRCNVFRYDIAANTEQMIDNPGSFQRAPSVTPGGTVYFSRGGKGCGASVALVRSRLDGQQEVLVQLQQGLDIRDTYAYVEPNGTTEVYYERNACQTKAGSDIYKVRDMALVPLEVTKEGTGTGTVSSSPAGISCGADCFEDYEVGTEVTLTATADPGSVFVGWSGSCSGNGACAVSMDVPHVVTATFLPLGSVTIQKDAIPNDPQVFQFDPDAGLAPDFQLVDNDVPTQSTKLISGVDPGTYEIREGEVPGWQLTDITCVGVAYTPELGNRRVTIQLEPNDAALCTFENTKNGQIRITKQTNPDGSGQSFAFARSYGSNVTLTDGQAHESGFTLTPGTYSVQENVPAGWQLTGTACTDGSIPGDITLSPGETVTCTFTNTQNGRIFVTKQTNPDGSGQSFTFTRSYGSSFVLSDGQTHDSGSTLSPGTYTVAENPVSGWDLVSSTCSDGSAPGSINLSAGETVTCTFSNRQDGKILVTKQTTPDGSPQTFGFSTNYGPGFSLEDGQTNDSGFLDPGTYSVSENAVSGWTLTSSGCSDGSAAASISLSAGETVTCTFNNRQLGRILVTKQTLPDGSAQNFTFTRNYGPDFTLSDGQTNDSGFTLDPGTYSVSENVPNGWTLTDTLCSDDSAPGSISLAAGETVSCTFENTQEGSITILEDSVDNDPQVFGFSATGLTPNTFTLDDDGAGSNQRTFSGLAPGTYSVSEDPDPAGWQLTDITCVGGGSNTTDAGRTATIGLDLGEDLTCTFTNTELGSIKMMLDTVPDDGQDFDYSAAGLSPTAFTLDDDDTVILPSATPDAHLFPTVLPGAYSVVETVPPLWNLDSISCVDPDNGSTGNTGTFTATVDLDPGEAVTCTFTNSLLP